jgi:hypothetical protein
MPMTNVAVVVMEPGSEWPGQVGDGANMVAIKQTSDDREHRTRERLDAIQRGKHCVRVAVLACNSATDAPALAHRAEVAGELLGAVKSAALGRLVLTASPHASPRLRASLFSLVGHLGQQLRSSSATVSLRFADPV